MDAYGRLWTPMDAYGRSYLRGLGLRVKLHGWLWILRRRRVWLLFLLGLGSHSCCIGLPSAAMIHAAQRSGSLLVALAFAVLVLITRLSHTHTFRAFAQRPV